MLVGLFAFVWLVFLAWLGLVWFGSAWLGFALLDFALLCSFDWLVRWFFVSSFRRTCSCSIVHILSQQI